ncbi:transcriptional regulatory protein YehT [Peptococcaceae bacterium CEB3]|nr:transcriptional regulatory protein YehT [Peptococcaceae bacterium CEB3]
MKLRALIVDDESPARKELRYLLQAFEDVQIVGEAANAIEALELIHNVEYSVIFLDIDMPGINGIEMAHQLRDQPNSPAVIFTTAHEEYAFDAFSVHALDYLLKPISPKRLDEALEKVREKEKTAVASHQTVPKNESGSPAKPLEVIPVDQRGKTILLRPDEIVYIYTDKDNVCVKTHKESYLTRFTLRDLESRLNPNQFFRSHRCYLVNIQRMRELIPYFNGTYTVVVDDAERSEIPVSRTQSRKLKEILGL